MNSSNQETRTMMGPEISQDVLRKTGKDADPLIYAAAKKIMLSSEHLSHNSIFVSGLYVWKL